MIINPGLETSKTPDSDTNTDSKVNENAWNIHHCIWINTKDDKPNAEEDTFDDEHDHVSSFGTLAGVTTVLVAKLDVHDNDTNKMENRESSSIRIPDVAEQVNPDEDHDGRYSTFRFTTATADFMFSFIVSHSINKL